MKRLAGSTLFALCVSLSPMLARADAPASQPASAPAAAGLDDSFIVILEKLADVIDTNKVDCDKAGDAINKLVTDEGDAIQKTRSAYLKATDAQRKQYHDRTVAIFKKASPGILACKKSQRFMTAMKTFPRLRNIKGDASDAKNADNAAK